MFSWQPFCDFASLFVTLPAFLWLWKSRVEKTLELEKMLYAFPMMSLNHHQIVSQLSKFKIEKSFPAKKN